MNELPDLSAVHEQAVGAYGLVDRGPVPYVISTGSFGLNRALTIGGYPGGRVIEVYGPEMSGKTTLALHACINAQSMGLSFGIIDMETALDEDYFRKLGVLGEKNVNWLCESPGTGEIAFELMIDWINAGVKLIVIDSVALMVPKAEIEGDMGEANMGLQARMMGQGLRKVSNLANEKGVILFFINQTRQKIGVVFGSNETTPGGNALKFYSTIRIRTEQVGDPITEGETIIGRFTKAFVKKNKVAAPGKFAMVPIVWGRGIASEMELFDELLIQGIVSKKSSFYYYKDKTLAGKKAMYEFIGENAQELLEVLNSKK